MEKFDRIVKAITNKDPEVLKGAIHPDFMLIRENSLVSKDEQLEFLQKMFEGDNEWLDFKCCYEDEDTLVWKYLLYILNQRIKNYWLLIIRLSKIIYFGVLCLMQKRYQKS
ncbi:nuclear transport factor 2 family protein [Paracoccaceae bacterium]|nr:nuclear transport factor 2 family protein [Paracoccaceae bacterium]